MVVGRLARGGLEQAAGEPAGAAEVGLAQVPQAGAEALADPGEAGPGLQGVGALVHHDHGVDDVARVGVVGHRGERVEAVVDAVEGADHHVGGALPPGRPTVQATSSTVIGAGLGGQLQPETAAVDEPVELPDQPDGQPVGVAHVLGGDDAPHLVRVRRHEPHAAGAADPRGHLDLADRRPALPVGGVERPQ